jgi:flagellum-specific peptidoglycan hydrolase FlgJ
MMSEDAERQARLAQIAQIAVALEKQTRCPASLMIAQWAVESRWGAKPVGHANYFGMKKNNRDPESCNVETEEIVNGKPVEEELQFADYDSLEDSARDYALLITEGEPYRAAWDAYSKDRDLAALIVAVAAKYATGEGYASLVSIIANQTNVQRAIVAARREALGV